MTRKLIAMALAAGTMLGAWADYKAENKNGYTWIYEQEDEESFIVGVAETPTGTLSFPSELGGKPVRNLIGYGGSGSFDKYQWEESDLYDGGGYWRRDWEIADDWLSGVTTVVIPQGVTNICDWAFSGGRWEDDEGVYAYGWSALRNVSLPDSLVSCYVEHAFRGTPFLTSKTFPEFILSASGTKLWGVKKYEGEYNFFNLVEVVVPASVTDIADYALGRIYIFVTHSNTGYYGTTYIGDGTARIVFAGARPNATDKAFAAEIERWNEETEDVDVTYMKTCWDAVYYQNGAEGWAWGEEWCGAKTYAVEDKIDEQYAVASNLKFDRVYGGGQYGDSNWMEYEIWDNGMGLYGDEYALIPVTGTGAITPVIIGDVPAGYLDKPQVWSDQKMFETFTPKGVAPSKWESDGDSSWYYEGAKAEWEWPKAIWPENKAVPNRRWIVVRAKDVENVWSGVWAFRVGISGTSEISDPVVVVPGDRWQIEQNFFAPSDFIRGVTISGYDVFLPWDEGVAFWADGFTNASRPRTQTFCIDNWKLMQSGNANALSFMVAVPSAGTLVVSSDDDDDAPAVKEAFAVKGNGIVSDIVTVKPTVQDRQAPINFWKTSNASHIRRIKVSGQTTLTFTCKNDDEEDFEFNRMYFFPESRKSVAVEVGYIKREVMNYGADSWGSDYIQGYVKGSGVYKSGETATLTAVSGDGEEFDHWEVRFGNLTLTDVQKTSSTLSFTVTDAMCGEMEDEEQIFISAIWKPKSQIAALPSIVGAGTVTGTGRYHEGAVVTLTATAADGCSFVKWSDGVTSPTRQIEVVAADIERVLYACFDAPNGVPDNGMTFGPFVAGDKVECDVGLVGYTAKGLPSGLKYDAKKGIVSGTAKVAGEYEATFTKKNEEDVTIMFSVREEEVSVGCAGLSGGTFTAGVAGNANGIPLEIESETGVKSVAVAKLPAGMKYDTKTGFITGAPTKPGD